jgi:hypothetical protein
MHVAKGRVGKIYMQSKLWLNRKIDRFTEWCDQQAHTTYSLDAADPARRKQ